MFKNFYFYFFLEKLPNFLCLYFINLLLLNEHINFKNYIKEKYVDFKIKKIGWF